MIIYSLYELCLDTTNALISKNKGERELYDSVIIKIKTKMELTPAEKEWVISSIIKTIVVISSIYIVNIWLFINKWLFRFTPWIDETPRKVNRLLWNLLGFFLIILGFIFQIIGSLII